MEEEYFKYEVWVEDSYTEEECLAKGMTIDTAKILLGALFDYWDKEPDLRIIIKRTNISPIRDEGDVEVYGV